MASKELDEWLNKMSTEQIIDILQIISKREPLTWQNRTRAIYDYHIAKASITGVYSYKNTATSLNLLPQHVARSIELVANWSEEDLIWKARSFNEAVKIMQRLKERQ